MGIDDRHSDSESDDCELFDDDSESCKSTVTSLAEDPADELDSVDVAIAEKRSEIWERIWTRLARYCAPLQSRYYTQRLAVIWACVRRAVYTDPMLMMLSQNYNAAIDMLEDNKLDLLVVEKLWTAIKELHANDVRAAIDDVLHPVCATGEYVVVFKTRVHKDLGPIGLPFHGWGHMVAIFPCYSCIRRTCKTVCVISFSVQLSY